MIAFPTDDGDSYWHDRASGEWSSYVMREVIPQVTHRFGADPRRIAIGGISMGGFGAYDLAMHYPGRFCAVGGHSPALWLRGADTAPGAFDDAEDFERNDVIATIRNDPAAFGPTPIWNDYGSEDPFAISDVALDETLEAAGADLTAHSWPGPTPAATGTGTGAPICASTPTPWHAARKAKTADGAHAAVKSIT